MTPRLRACVLAAAVVVTGVVLHAQPASAFCGFYVAKGDASLYNHASQVVIARDGDRTILTMSNDYQGPMEDFAIVVPVPSVLEKGQVHVGERAVIEHLDAFSAPRLVEYFDEDPCAQRFRQEKMMMRDMAMSGAMAPASASRAKTLGVTVEAQYTVGEYDIVILSAKESTGLETWLRESGYKLPRGASRALAPYIAQKLKFFVAKVNLKEQAKTGFTYLRPIQVAYESSRFMLPIRLGMLNAKGEQDLLIYVLTSKGRVETTNYRTVKVPSDVELPPYVKGEFADLYRSVFATAHEKEGGNAVFIEHFWDMAWCDPCASEPLSREELQRAGVFWLEDAPSDVAVRGPSSGPQAVLITRLHARYDNAHFPEDLMFRETDDRQNFQARYVLRHPFKGATDCEAAKQYRADLAKRQEEEARTLVKLTGWNLDDVRRKAGLGAATTGSEPWWKGVFR